jgi:cytochrome c
MRAWRSAMVDLLPRISEKRVMKLSGILSGAVVLLPLTLVAQAQGLGDAQRGAQVFAQCKICHSLEAGKNMVGPSLHGLIGRKAGSVPGYAYSPAMKNANITWNDDALSKYLADPKAFIPGDKMVFLGIKDPSKLGDLLAYLNQATR